MFGGNNAEKLGGAGLGEQENNGERTREQEQQLGEQVLKTVEGLDQEINGLRGNISAIESGKVVALNEQGQAVLDKTLAQTREELGQAIVERNELERQPDIAKIQAQVKAEQEAEAAKLEAARQEEERRDAEIEQIMNGRTAAETVEALDKVIEKLQGEITHMESVYTDPSMKTFQEKMIAEARAELAERIRQRNLVESDIVEVELPIDEQAAGGELDDNNPKSDAEVKPKPVEKKELIDVRAGTIKQLKAREVSETPEWQAYAELKHKIEEHQEHLAWLDEQQEELRKGIEANPDKRAENEAEIAKIEEGKAKVSQELAEMEGKFGATRDAAMQVLAEARNSLQVGDDVNEQVVMDFATGDPDTVRRVTFEIPLAERTVSAAGASGDAERSGAEETDAEGEKPAAESEKLSPEKRRELANRGYEQLKKKNPNLLGKLLKKPLLIAMSVLMVLSMTACGQNVQNEPDQKTLDEIYGAASTETITEGDGLVGENQDLTQDTRAEFINGTRYDYSYDYESPDKLKEFNFGVNKSDCYNDREATTEAFMFICANQPETLAANVAAFPSIVKAVFGDALPGNLNNFDTAKWIDNRLSDPNNVNAGYEQGALLAALETALRDSDTDFEFYEEYDREKSFYIMGSNDIANGEENTPENLYLNLSAINRNGEAQVRITIAVKDKMGNIIDHESGDYNMPCGFQRNIEFVKQTETPKKTETPGNTDPGDTDPGDTDPGDTDPGDTDPGDTDPGDTDPGDTDPGDTDPGDTDPGDTDPGDTDPGDTDPGDTDPGDTDPGDTDPGDTTPDTTLQTKNDENQQRIANKITDEYGVVHTQIGSGDIGTLDNTPTNGMFNSQGANNGENGGNTGDLGTFVPTSSNGETTEDQQRNHEQQLQDDQQAARPNENGQAPISQDQGALNDYFQSILQQTEDRGQQLQDLQQGINDLSSETFTDTNDQQAQRDLITEAQGAVDLITNTQNGGETGNNSTTGTTTDTTETTTGATETTTSTTTGGGETTTDTGNVNGGTNGGGVSSFENDFGVVS